MLRFVPAFEGFRLHRVHKRPVVEHYEGVASLRRFPVLHAIELTFKLPATFLEIALSLLRCQECQLDFDTWSERASICARTSVGTTSP